MTRSVDVHFRPIEQWPDGKLLIEAHRKWPKFSASWTDTVELLDRELWTICAKDVVVELDVKPGAVRVDGVLRADVKVGHPGVILSFGSQYGPLRYWTDLYSGRTVYRGGSSRFMPGWHANLRAIALGLEALRTVERYGIARRGEQYMGWSALPPATPMGAAMTVEEACRFLGEHGGHNTTNGHEMRNPVERDRAYRVAAKRLHPDVGGDTELFKRLNDAYEKLKAS